MKTLITLAFLCLITLFGCKKSNTGPSAMQVQISGLTAKTAINLKITDDTQNGSVVINLVKQFGNATYNTSPVSANDHLSVTYSTNIPDDLQGDGDGTIKFVYKGEVTPVAGGILSGSTTETVPTP